MEKLVEKHHKSVEMIRTMNNQMRENAIKSLGEVFVNARNYTLGHTKEMIDNENEIETLTKQLQINAVQLSKESKQWNQSVKRLEDSLAELGNLEIVAKTMEDNLNQIDTAVRKLIMERKSN